MKTTLFFLLVLLNMLSTVAAKEGDVSVSAYAYGGLIKWSARNEKSALEMMSTPNLEVLVGYFCRARESENLRWPYIDCDSTPMASVRLSSYQWVRINNEEIIGRYLAPDSRSEYLYKVLSGHGEPLIEVGFNASGLHLTGYPSQELSFRLSNFDDFVASVKDEQFLDAESEVFEHRIRYVLTFLFITLVFIAFAWGAFKLARFFHREYRFFIESKYGLAKLDEAVRSNQETSSINEKIKGGGLEGVVTLKKKAVEHIMTGDISLAKRVIEDVEDLKK
ncbi:hypothetical protein [Halomonas alkalicola]|uniref:hypothetical protein n=1 Tax=Halomonas alkalicola TaxID=1930622 RepID=UPI00265E9A1C|nr:hypothetical protein [Halomonas alkalicola]